MPYLNRLKILRRGICIRGFGSRLIAFSLTVDQRGNVALFSLPLTGLLEVSPNERRPRDEVCKGCFLAGESACFVVKSRNGKLFFVEIAFDFGTDVSGLARMWAETPFLRGLGKAREAI